MSIHQLFGIFAGNDRGAHARCGRHRLLAASVVALTLAVGFPAQAEEAALSLSVAEALALEGDPVLGALEARAWALDEKAIAEGELPDPKAKFGIMNLPTDSFSRTQEAMTMVQVGVQQAFPRGDTLSLKTERTGLLADADRVRILDERRRILRAVRLAWYDLYYWSRANAVIDESLVTVDNLIQITQYLYSTGRRNQQDVIRAQLEYSLLEDRRVDIAQKTDTARAELAKWIGEAAAAKPLPLAMPPLAWPGTWQEIETQLSVHPRVQVEDRLIASRESEIDIAEEAYMPGWMTDVTYGFRDGADGMRGERADFLSVMVSVELPFFTGDRQDRRVSESKHQVASAQYRRDDVLRELHRMLGVTYADWERLSERIALYEQVVLIWADENVEATMRAYQDDAADFTALMRAELIEIDTRLKEIRIMTSYAQAQAKLLYLAGDE
jgi:outer membrane protein TolC